MATQRKKIKPLSGVDTSIRESTRTKVAYLTVGGFILVIFVTVLGGWVVRGVPTSEVLQVIAAEAAIFGGLAGAAIGFYFGTGQRTD